MEQTFRILPRFVRGSTEQFFTIEFCTVGTVRGLVVVVPPFAEEMNRCRQMMSRQARLLAGQGFRVIVPDLAGTGDSLGDFSTADWDVWSRDLAALIEASGVEKGLPVTLVAVRLGALLALHTIREHNVRTDKLILWCPSLSGRAEMNQFLRLRLMSSMLGKAGDKQGVPEMRQALSAGETVEVAGYEISPALYASIIEMDILTLMTGMTIPVFWFEIVSDNQPISLAATKAIDALSAARCSIESEAVVGPKFWSTAETTYSDELARATLRVLDTS